MLSLETPVLTVDPSTIHRIDTRNVEHLFSIWTLFSRCSGSIDEGRRLENLSWRLWNRETFCCAPGEANATTSAISISQRSSERRYTADIPNLSGSIKSIDEEAIESDSGESASTSAPLTTTRPRVQRQGSDSNKSRGKERHITPDELEKMVITIKKKKDLKPLTMPLANEITSPQVTSSQLSNTATPIISAPGPEKASPTPSSPQKSLASTITGGISASSRIVTTVVRGFSPSQMSSSYRSIPLVTNTLASVPKSMPATKTRLTAAKKLAMSAGGSSQSDNDSFQESSLESRMLRSKKSKARFNMFQLGGSSAEDENFLRDSMQQSSYKSSLSIALRRPEQKKETFFKEKVATRTIEEMSDNGIDESAIDDDESSDWEDWMEDSEKLSIDDKLSFPRVEVRHNLTSRRSLITTILHQNDRAAALQKAASKFTSAFQRSRTSSPQGPSDAPSPESDDDLPLRMKSRMLSGQEFPRTGA
ncbi:hypothetical protein V496_10018 [Pseudogymnoascus sp. VKM F-4515 (FW-2607)]|nr:hypothetical protein V496_10018 [Pseudogymnoascus sp. VKM F-4515 (FW-2607)]